MENFKTILETINLSIGYDHRNLSNAIARNINLKLEQGKLISLIGANGIGKSTLLRTLATLQNPLAGSIQLHSQNINLYTSSELAKLISIVLTEKLPAGNLTVFELIAMGRQPYTNWIGKLAADDILMINRAMELTETAYLKDKKHFEISDGQLQKVMIARALAQDTPMIILDEPTTHLDLQHKISLFTLLKKLAHETDKCILFSTHDIEMAIEMSDEMILMTAEKACQGTPTEFISNDSFNNLFPDKAIYFDAEKVKFVFKNK